MFRFVLAGCLALLPVQVMANSGNAKEAMQLFGNICVTTLAQLPKITAEMEKLQKIHVAAHIPSEKAAPIVSPTEKDNVWFIRSPATQQKIMVTYDSRGICAMHVNEAESKDMASEFEQ